MHVTFDSVAAAAAWLVVQQDSDWKCQSRRRRTRRCETFDRTRGEIRSRVLIVVVAAATVAAAAAAGGATWSLFGDCCTAAQRGSRPRRCLPGPAREEAEEDKG